MDGDDFNRAAKKDAQHGIANTPCASDYLYMLDDENDLTEEQKLELLEVLFNIMKSFVMMGYGMEAVDRLVNAFQKSSDIEPHLLESDNKHKEPDHG